MLIDLLGLSECIKQSKFNYKHLNFLQPSKIGTNYDPPLTIGTSCDNSPKPPKKREKKAKCCKILRAKMSMRE